MYSSSDTTESRARSPEVLKHTVGGEYNNRNTPDGGIVEQKKIEQTDRRAALLEAFDSMSDESQVGALCMLQSIARSSPRRSTPGLRLVASGDYNVDLRKPASGS